jgi:hypothetical protein
MNSSLRLLGGTAFAAAVLFLATARCSSSDGPPGNDGCVPLDGVCGQAACCTLSAGGDPLVCDADAGTCRVECIGRNHDCSNNHDGCCPGYGCQVDGLGYGTCK